MYSWITLYMYVHFWSAYSNEFLSGVNERPQYRQNSLVVSGENRTDAKTIAADHEPTRPCVNSPTG